MSFQSNYLRKGRRSIPRQAYLITACTHRRYPWFGNPDSATVVANELQQSDKKRHSNTFAYVVMPDHFHWLMEIGTTETLSRLIGRIKANSTRSLKKLVSGETKIWQEGFHDHAVRQEEQIQTVINYVVNNPLRSGLAHSLTEYPFWYAINTDVSPL